MRKKELKLTDIPGDYLSKEDFYKIAHISKRTALWLIETELVLAERPEKPDTKSRSRAIPRG